MACHTMLFYVRKTLMTIFCGVFLVGVGYYRKRYGVSQGFSFGGGLFFFFTESDKIEDEIVTVFIVKIGHRRDIYQR